FGEDVCARCPYEPGKTLSALLKVIRVDQVEGISADKFVRRVVEKALDGGAGVTNHSGGVHQNDGVPAVLDEGTKAALTGSQCVLFTKRRVGFDRGGRRRNALGGLLRHVRVPL